MIGIGAVTHVHVHGHAHETGQVANTRSLNTSGGNAAQALILTGVTDTPNHVQPEAALIGEVEDQRVIVTAESETGKETRTGIETENETVKEIERMKETLRFYHQYLKKSLWSRIKKCQNRRSLHILEPLKKLMKEDLYSKISSQVVMRKLPIQRKTKRMEDSILGHRLSYLLEPTSLFLLVMIVYSVLICLETQRNEKKNT